MQDEKESSRERGKGIKRQLADLWENFIRAGILGCFCGKPMQLRRDTGQFTFRSKLHSVHLSCIWFLQKTQRDCPLMNKKNQRKAQSDIPPSWQGRHSHCTYLDGYVKCLSEEIFAFKYGNIYATEYGLEPHLNQHRHLQSPQLTIIQTGELQKMIPE